MDTTTISRYTRAQAIEDGVLIDVSEVALEASFKIPVAITAAVYSELKEIPDKYSHEDYDGRLWDVFTMLRYAIKMNGNSRQLDFEMILHSKPAYRGIKGKNRMDSGQYLTKFRSKISGGDMGEPVITIMNVNED